MELFTNLYAMGTLGVFMVLHVVCVLLPELPAKILGYVNIALHAAGVVAFAFFGLTIEEAVLLYLISVFTYTLAQYVRYTVNARRAALADTVTDEAGDERCANESVADTAAEEEGRA